MALRDKPPFRADHVGSLLRPAALLEAREEHAAGRIDDGALRAAEDEAIRAVVQMQRDAGLRSATDGEFRRASWHMDFIYSLGGISHAKDNISVKFHNPDGDIEFTPAALHVDEKIRLEHTIFGDDFEFLRDTADDGQTPKLTIPSPSMVHYRGGAAAIDPNVYPDRDDFWSDLTSAYADQVAAIAGLGCTYLQFDDTSLAYLNDPEQRAMIAERGEDADHLHEQYIRHINEALEGRPEGMTITTHMCRGNFRSSWVAEGGYDFVAEALFNELGVDGFFLEYDDARSGGFEPLRFVPKGKMVVLGLVTTKRGELEQKDELKRRIEEATQYVPLDQLCLSPQCGFSSTVEGNALSYDQEVAKLRLIVETSDEVWGILSDTAGPPAARVATASDLDLVTETVSLAFRDDPLWSWAFPDATRIGPWWRFLIESALRYPSTWMVGQGAAVAVWIPPDGFELTEEEKERTEPLLRDLDAARAPAIMQLLERFEDSHPHDRPHYYLSLLGTHPQHRGKGYGMGLLEENLRRIDDEGMPAYLESSNPTNDRRYEALGFARTGAFSTPDGQHSVSTMWREPR